MRVAFIGLGVMGYPMAGHLASAGNKVTVYNRTAAKAQRWATEYGGQVANTPAAAARDAEFVFVCVGDDDDLWAVCDGDEGALAGMAANSILIDHTTASADIARRMHEQCAARGIGFIDAPVSGGQAGAENGQLTIMAGGAAADFERAEPVMQCYAKFCGRMGEAGSGQLTKMVNQICIAGLVQSLAEGLNFALHAGLDPQLVIAAIGKGAAQSWQMDNRWETMVAGEFDFGFAVEWMRKDLRIALAEAQRNGSALPVAQLVDSFYADVQAQGGNRWDTSSLMARLSETPQPE